MGSASAATPVDSPMGGGGAPAGGAPDADTIQAIRAVGQALDAVAQANAALAPIAAQARSALQPFIKQMLTAASTQLGVQTPSSVAVPTAGA
jgi:hypothetical protein